MGQNNNLDLFCYLRTFMFVKIVDRRKLFEVCLLCATHKSQQIAYGNAFKNTEKIVGN